MEEGRVCNKCKTHKTWDSFSLNSKGMNGRKSICKTCSNSAEASRNKTKKEQNPEEFYLERRKKMLKINYGLTPEEYDNMLHEQGGCCAICKEEGNRVGSHLFVDHCHKNGHNRGLLCYHCNTLLGMCFDSVDILSSAIKYLERDGGVSS